jgi:hypothetical protein
MLITYFNSTFGLSIASDVKINITDILAVFLFLKYFCTKRYTLKKILASSKVLRIFIFLVVLMSLMIGPGLLSGGELSNSIRVVRNVWLIIVTIIIVKIECQNWSLIKLMRLIYFCAIVVIVNSFCNFLLRYQEYNYYTTYRTNAYLIIFLFIFIFVYNPEIATIKYVILKVILSIGLIMVAFMSQERLELVGIAVGIIIAIFNGISSCFSVKKVNRNKIIRNLFFVVLIASLLCIAITKLLTITTVSNYLDFYMNYRINIIYSNSSFTIDSSMSTRLEQIKEIIRNTNLLNFWIGNGLCSIYYLDNITWYVADTLVAWLYKDMGIIGAMSFILIILKSIQATFQISVSVRLKRSIIAAYLGLVFYIMCTPNMILSIFDAMSFGLIIAIIELIRNFGKKYNIMKIG